MKKSFILMSFAAALMSVPSISFSQEEEKQPPPPPPPGAEGGRPERRGILQQLDTDGDGKVSKEEYLQNAAKEAERRFENVDANNDGVIEQSEFDEAARRLREANRGGDGARRPGDRPGGFRRPGPEGGRDGDGFRRPPEGERSPGERRPNGEGGQGQRRGFGGGEFLRGLDTNEDGEVTKEEFQASNDKRFEQLDANKDGKITRDELEELANRFRGERGFRGDREGGRGGPPPEGRGPAPTPTPTPAPAEQ